MIHPSYVDLMEVVNSGVEEGETPVINSRYSIVMATAKRARQIVNGDEPLVDGMEGRKPLSIAVEELNSEAIRILGDEEAEAANEAYRIHAEEERARRAEEAAALAAEMGPGEEAYAEDFAEDDLGDAAFGGAEEDDAESEGEAEFDETGSAEADADAAEGEEDE